MLCISCAIILTGKKADEPQENATHRVNLISDVLPFGGLWYGEPNAIANAIGYAKFYSRSRDAVIHALRFSGQCDRDA